MKIMLSMDCEHEITNSGEPSRLGTVTHFNGLRLLIDHFCSDMSWQGRVTGHHELNIL